MPQTLTSTITDPSATQVIWDVITNGSTDATIGEGGVIMLASASAGGVTINLPTAGDNLDRIIVVKKTDSTNNAVFIDPNGSETIDGETSKSLSEQFTSLTLVSDGSNWLII